LGFFDSVVYTKEKYFEIKIKHKTTEEKNYATNSLALFTLA
jgi:hypothetical protein